MKLLASLKPMKGSTHNSKALGRGRGSGKGGTSTKGGKGQKARKGAPIRRGFEGGQTPLARRMPKFGFSNQKFETRYEIVNLSQLNALKGEVTPEAMKKAGLIHNGSLVKILGQGELKQAVQVKAHAFSASAKTKIESAGGKVEVI